MSSAEDSVRNPATDPAPDTALDPAPDPLGQALLGYATTLSAEPPPPVSLVWFRAERRRRALALERAQRPLRIMQGVGLLCGLAAAVWMVWHFAQPARLASVPEWPQAGGPMLALMAATALLVVGGCWAMLAASRSL